VKGKVKEKAGQVTNNSDLEAEGKAEHNAGKVEKKVGRSKKSSGGKLGGLCPEHVPAFGTTDAPLFPAQVTAETRRTSAWHLEFCIEAGYTY